MMIKIEKNRFILIIVVISMALMLYFSSKRTSSDENYEKTITTNYKAYLSHKSDSIKNIALDIDNFLKEAKNRNRHLQTEDIRLSFSQYEPLKAKKLTTIGYCFYDESEKVARIYINPVIVTNRDLAWNTIFHELGHCLLGLHHDDLFIDNNQTNPKSLMISLSSQKIPNDHFSKNKEYYLNELFSKKEDNMNFIQQIFNYKNSWLLFKSQCIHLKDIILQNNYNEIPGFFQDSSSEIFYILSFIFLGTFLYMLIKSYGKKLINLLKVKF